MHAPEAPCARNLVVCSDGTGNTFHQSVSNVSRLVQALDLAHVDQQIVFYDQGIGTNPSLVEGVNDFRNKGGKDREALRILDPPKVSLTPPLPGLLGMAAGYGLKANLREMYQALARTYNDASTDFIFLMGFSRGAFTVRALAGLLYRCGLPASQFARDDKAFACCFAQAWAAYKPHCEDLVAVDRFRSTYGARDIDVHFLGIWDTVKSYGGIWPQSLPHLRHNPAARQVRHALAIHERRSWFLPTSWGGIDTDAGLIPTLRPDKRYDTQTVKEVWFRGCHSDVGGGYEDDERALISFRWMLGEATHAGLLLHPGCGDWIFDSDDFSREPKVHESFHVGWWLSDWVPRWELDNSTRPPGYPLRWPGNGTRCVESFRRDRNICFHQSVGVTPREGVAVHESLRRLTREEVLAKRAIRQLCQGESFAPDATSRGTAG